MKKIIKITESDLHSIIRESVNRMLREWDADEYDEYDDEDDYPTDQEVDVLDLYLNSNLADKYSTETKDSDDTTFETLENNIPTALVRIKSSYSKPEMDYYNGTGWAGGYNIDASYLDKEDANKIKELEQSGQIPQGMADDLICAIQEQGYDQAEEEIEDR